MKPYRNTPFRHPYTNNFIIYCISIICTLYLLPIKIQAAIEKETQSVKDTTLYYEQIADKNFCITVDRVAPMGKKAITLTNNYTLRISGDTIYSHLPYIGRAFNAPYGGGEALRFKEKTENYTYEKTRKNNIRCKFKVRTKDDYYTIQIEITKSGATRISVTSAYKQTITYYGTLRCDE